MVELPKLLQRTTSPNSLTEVRMENKNADFFVLNELEEQKHSPLDLPYTKARKMSSAAQSSPVMSSHSYGHAHSQDPTTAYPRARAQTVLKSGASAEGRPQRRRSQSMVSALVPDIHFSGDSSESLCYGPMILIKSFVVSILKRFYVYMVVLTVLSLTLYSTSHHTFYGVGPGPWFSFLILLEFVDFVAATIDHVLFLALDKYLSEQFRFAYSLHAFKGQIGLFIVLIILSNGMSELAVAKAIPKFGAIISACVIILICQAMKNYYQHMRYIVLLQKRFKDRLELFETYKAILSTLSMNKIPRASYAGHSSSVCRSRNTSLGSQGSFHLSADSAEGARESSEAPASDVPPGGLSIIREETAEAEFPKPSSLLTDAQTLTETFTPFHEEFQNSPSSSSPEKKHLFDKLHDRFQSIPNFERFSLNGKKVKNVFSEIVEEVDMEEFVEDMSNDAALFWKRMAELNIGVLRIFTYDGVVGIQNRKQAKLFASKLYQHLSRNGEYEIPSVALRALLTDHFETNRIKAARLMIGGNVDAIALLHLFNEMFRTAETLNSHESSNVEKNVSLDDIQYAVMLVFKEMKYAASSLHNFGELQLTLQYVVDIAFWLVMLVVFQIVVRLDLSQMLAPGVTLVLVSSFALGPFLSNMFLSIAFVLFMLPFDIGNRISVGVGPQAMTCFVSSIDLFYTTVHTLYNEKVRIPNQVLFNEKIVNYAESKGMTYEIVMTFNFEGPTRCTESLVDMYIEKLRHYTLVENKSEWQDFDAICSGLDVAANKFNVSFWVTHRCPLQQSNRVIPARTKFYRKLRDLAHELEMSFMATTLPLFRLDDKAQGNNTGQPDGGERFTHYFLSKETKVDSKRDVN